ncbi:putative gustatory receptor 59e [Anopheles cruzii]|uniref:putative gustatory receptor 59e n=1 Tax=Anopheles cruzii TaxID=68878 RepID=UPI0022EC2047|nr:putative gustatory receptor 59e [Anopheles cruzii]
MGTEAVFHSALVLQDELTGAVGHLLRTCQLFGVAPWNVELYGKPKRTRWTRAVRALNGVYSASIIVAVCTANLLHHSDASSSHFFAIRTLYLCEDVTVAVITILALVGCQWLRRSYSKCALQIVLLGTTLSRVGSVIGFERIEVSISKALLGTLLYSFAIVAIDLVRYFDHLSDFVCRTLLYTVPNVINVLALYQYFVLLWLIAYHYRAINGQLKTFSRAAFPPKSHHKRKHVEVFSISPPYANDRANVLDILRKAHLQLSELTAQANDCFGLLILLTTVSSFAVLTLQLFGVYKATTIQTWTYDHTTKLAYVVLWIVLHGMKVLLVLYPCRTVQEERDRTGPILYTFIPSAVDYSINNALLHEKDRFMACGVIALDMTLVNTMVGALTTYLVILIQFDSTLVQSVAGGTPNASLHA